MIFFLAMCVLLLALPVEAVVYYVSTTGSNGATGTSPGTAWQTIQHAANTAGPGDTVNVAAGTYQERVVFNTAGSPGQPITFLCTTNRACVVDGGTQVSSGWTQSAGFVTGVFERANSAFGFGSALPAHATFNDQMIIFVRPGITPATDYIQLGPGSSEWTGIEASCRNYGSTTRCHFEDNGNPNTKNLKLAPEEVGAFHVAGSTKGHLVFDGFYWKNAYHCVCIEDFAHHVTVQNSTCTNGYWGYEVRQGAHNNLVQDSTFALNYIYEDHGKPLHVGPAPGTEDPIQRNVLNGLRNAMPITANISVRDAGTNNTFLRNTIGKTGAGGFYVHSDEYGVDAGYTNANTTFSYNTVHHCQDYCILEQLTGAPNLTITHNTLHTYHDGIRLGRLFDGKGPMYIAFNTFRNEGGCPECARAGDLDFSAFPQLNIPICQNTSCYFYHNSYNNRDSALLVYSQQNLDRTFWVNDIFSARRLWVLELDPSPITPVATPSFFSRNWVGGVNAPASPPSWVTQPVSWAVPNRIWADNETAFALPASHAAIDLGLNLSQSWSAGAAGSQPALPDATPGYFAGTAPDAGAVESGDVTPPTVSSVTPLAGAANVAVGTSLTATFSEAMTAGTITASTVELRTPTNALVPATVSYTAGTFTATLTPTSSLAGSTTYTASILTGVTDAAGNALATAFPWSFTTLSLTPPDKMAGRGRLSGRTTLK